MTEITKNVFISRKALERLKKDRFVKEHRKWYIGKIIKIIENLTNFPTERIEEFNVSPKGHEKKRIAWHMTKNKNKIYIFIDDLLYHESNERYVDNWNEKVISGKIKLKDYKGYANFYDII